MPLAYGALRGITRLEAGSRFRDVIAFRAVALSVLHRDGPIPIGIGMGELRRVRLEDSQGNRLTELSGELTLLERSPAVDDLGLLPSIVCDADSLREGHAFWMAGIRFFDTDGTPLALYTLAEGETYAFTCRSAGPADAVMR